MAWTKTYDGEAPVRVNKWLGQSGVCSRREAEGLIERGLVMIDGEALTNPGHKIEPGQTLTLKEAGQQALDAKITAVLHKPVGIVSAQPEDGQIPAARLIKRDTLYNPKGHRTPVPSSRTVLAPLGRLDMDSRGLLLLSEDGVLAKAIIGPQTALEKEYLVYVKGDITEEKLSLLRHGLELDDRQLKPAIIKQKGQQLTFILREGRNRQIRRMCDLVDLRVVDLIRVRIGPLSIGNLPEGKWRPLMAAERAALLKQP